MVLLSEMAPRLLTKRRKEILGIAHRLAARRLQLKMVQRDVERKAKIAPTTLSRLERQYWPDDREPPEPRRSTINSIAKVLQIDPNRILYPDPELDAIEVPEDRISIKRDGKKITVSQAKIAIPRNGSTRRRGRPRQTREQVDT